MSKSRIDEFARLLVAEVRDRAIRAGDQTLESQAAPRSLTARRWRNAREVSEDDLLRIVIPDCVDCAIFYLLHAIDEGLINLKFTSTDGECIDLKHDGGGELAGWYMGADSWRDRFSEERRY